MRKPFDVLADEIRCQFVFSDEIRCQFVFSGKNDELTLDFPHIPVRGGHPWRRRYHFQDELASLGMARSPSYVPEPEGDAVAERFIRTLEAPRSP